MRTIAPAAAGLAPSCPRERVSWLRLLWLAPLTVVVAALVCLGLQRMPQLGPALVTLAIEGAVAAVVVFILFVLFVPRAVYWFRIAGVIALVLSWVPDIALGAGGGPMQTAMRYVAPLRNLRIPGLAGPGGPPGGGPPPGAQNGGPPPGFFSALPFQQVLVLMLLHGAVAAVSILMLPTLSRRRQSA